MSEEKPCPAVAGQHRPQDGGAAAPPARSGASRADGRGRRDGPGAPPCNTAPGKYNPDTFKLLRHGVDSLYLSYPGLVAEDWDKRLAKLKELAQSESEAEQALAQVTIGEHLFEVLDKGRGRFAYILVDNCYRLQVSNGRAKVLPLAYVQISSEYLSAVGVEQAEAALAFVVETLGVVQEPANISRVDLFADFTAELRMDAFDPLEDWITRTQSIDLHYRWQRFSGWSFGMGGAIAARLYDKTLEIEKKSRKFYLHELWRAAGWDGEKTVWRMEFEAKRDSLKELCVFKVRDLLKLQAALWGYHTQDWLRLAIPSTTDSNPARWPNHPFWDQISAVFHSQEEQPRLARFTPARLPADERLFLHGLGGLTSFMAREGIDDLGEGVGAYLHEAERFHNARHDKPGQGFEHYVARKVRAKNRRYNTVNNRPDDNET